MRLSTILKEYNLNSDIQYFDIILQSRLNGQNSQAKEQFSILPIESKKAFLKYIIYWTEDPKKTGYLEFFINAM